MNIPKTYTHWDKDRQQFANAACSTERFWTLSDDLTWLALRCDNWVDGRPKISRDSLGGLSFVGHAQDGYTHNQWLTRRQELGLEQPEVTPQEDEAWDEKRMDTIGANGPTGEHYRLPPNPPPSKYHRLLNDQWVDVYDVLTAFEVTNPADAHAIKKMLLPGLRGAKDGIQDRREAIRSLERAIQIEQELHDSHL